MNRRTGKLALALGLFIVLFSLVGSALAAPNISGLSPSSGAIGASVTISGTGFGTTQGSGTVSFNGTTTTVTSWNDTSLIMTVPTGATTGNVVVFASGVNSNGAAFTVTSPYAYSLAISIDHTKVPNTDQTNFPVLISGTYPFLATTANGGSITNANGYDIAFTADAAGASPLAFECESYSASTGAVVFWVKVPTVSHTTDTVVYVLFGNSSITTDQSNRNGVWDSNFAGVWHLPNGTTLSSNDSTVNGNNATIYGTPAATAGQIGGAATFGASTADYLQAGDSPSLRIPSTVTLSAWIYNTSDNSNGGMIAEKRDATNPGSNYNYGLSLQPGGQLLFQFNDGSYQSSFSPTGVVPKNTWAHVAVSVNESTQLVTFYVNGALNSTTTKSGTMPSSGSGVLQIGNYGTYGGGGFSFEGILDEVRISSSVRSADWIATEYNNQSNPSAFLHFGVAAISGLSTYSGVVGTTVTITGSSFGSAQGTSNVTFNGVAAIPTNWSNASITVTVPTGATSGDVVVTELGAGSNGVYFTVPTAWSNGYVHRRAISINHSMVPNTNQSNFPMLISGAYSYLATTGNGGGVTNANGYDIIFTSDAAGTNALAYERESYNPSTGAVNYWVKIPTIFHTSTETVIYVFYGNSSVTTDQSNGSGVWDSNYKGIWHLPNGTTLSANDSTANGNNATIYGTPAATAGQIDGAATFGASTADYLQASDSASLRIASTITLSAWIYNTSDNPNGGLIAEKRDATNPGNNFNYSFWLETGGQLFFQFNDGSYHNSATSTGVVPKNAWTHVAVSVNESTQLVSFYVNGTLISTVAKSGTMPSTGSGVLQIGNYGTLSGGVFSFEGILDEVRISSSVRTADWIATEYNNQTNPSAFYYMWADDDGGPSITSMSPVSGSYGTLVTITGSGFGASQGTSSVTFNGTPATATSWSNNQIIVPVPVGATSGNVVVMVSGISSNSLTFAVVLPTISNVSPSSGTTGTSVTITGTNFGATQGSSTVTFNGALATPTGWSSTSIVVPVPSAANSGNVVVSVSGAYTNGLSFTVTPIITTVSATTGSIGGQVGIVGSGFGASQGSSQVTLNGTSVTINSWSSTSIQITIPAGATSGPLLASTGVSNNSNSFYFTVTANPLPAGWLDQDLGATGGSASYSSGVYTVTAMGPGVLDNSTSDSGFHYVYQPLSGDGTIIARVVSVTWGMEAGVMIRETLNPSATMADTTDRNSYGERISFYTRTSTGGGATRQDWPNVTSPYWVKVVKNGASFTSYESADGVSWIQVGNSVTISMAANIYVGFGAGQAGDSGPTTATFDNVSVTSSTLTPPVITSVSATTGSVGSQVVIAGTGFGATQGSNAVMINDASVAINSWSATSISITILTGATSGPLAVLISPTMNASNTFYFTVTSNPLPSGWLDQNIGTTAGSATYANGVYTITSGGLGVQVNGTMGAGLHYVYQGLLGDGIIVARVANVTYGMQAGVMIRETFNPNSTMAFTADGNSYGERIIYWSRTSTGSGSAPQAAPNTSAPYWVKAEKSGTTFTGFESADGVNWTQVGTNETINMAASIYIGLAVGQDSASGPGTATFDHVSVTSGLIPFVNSVSPTSGIVGTLVAVNGSDFGNTQGSSTVNFNGTAVTSITSWSSTQIVVTIPGTVSTGLVTVTVAGMQSLSDAIFTALTPALGSLTPPAGPAGGTVTLTGYNFGTTKGSSTVQFNGLNAGILSWSDTTISATVPGGATTGPVTVTEGGVISNSLQFTVDGYPTITGISPIVAQVGMPVTISGSGFGSSQYNSVVAFDGVSATVINSWSDTQIVALVPPFTGTGVVTVTVAGITAQGPALALTRSTTLTDSLGNVSSYTAVDVGGVWKPISELGTGCSSCTSRGIITTTYDGLGNVLTRTDSTGHTTTYTYDTSNNMLSQSVPLNGTTNATTSYTYNSFGEVLTVTDPIGNVTTNAYDANGNLTSVTSPAPNGTTTASVTTFTYDSKGELLTITDPLSHVTTMTYTTAGLIATIKDAQNNITTYSYDAKGNCTSVTDALSHQTTFAYDAMNRLTTITYPSSPAMTTTFAYDSRGRRTSVTDQNSKTTTYVYDDADRLTSVTDATTPGNVTTYDYDTESNLTSITDAKSNVTAFTYDAFGRVKQTNFPSSLSEYYYYDADNNLTSKVDRKGQTITYLYDALNRLSSKTYPDSTAVDYTYDLVGKIQQVNDPTGTYTFAYDNMGRMIGTTTSYSFLGSRNFTNAYAYDAASNRTAFTDPENGATAYTYDTLNRLTTLAPPSAFSGTATFGFTYDALSRRTQMTRPNSVATNYAYDNLSRLSSVLHQLSGSTIDGASYTLDSAGNRTTKTDQRASVTTNYGYDSIYQLLSATQGSTTTESYSYDPVGNRTASLGVSSYTTNASNELTATSGASYTYDSNGNTLTKVVSSNTTTYAWDYENRLTGVTLPSSGGTVTFKYDPFGRRIYKSLSTGGTSVFAYDGDNLIEETNSSGTVVARYEQTENVDEPLAMLRSSTTSYYNADGLGSVTSLANGSGTLTQSYTYDSFGKQTASSGSLVNPFQYTGRELDSETGLYYYRARYYDPTVGKFIGEDPIRFGAGANFYPYANNSPASLSDPTGLSPFDNVFGRGLSDCVIDTLKKYFPSLDLSKIRLHIDKSVDPIFGASAITQGNQIYYDPNSFDTTSGGLSLLGHELTHSVQYAKSGFASFYYNYARNYLANRKDGMDNQHAYEQIPVEVEANKMERKIFDDLSAKFGLLKPICKDLCK